MTRRFTIPTLALSLAGAFALIALGALGSDRTDDGAKPLPPERANPAGAAAGPETPGQAPGYTVEERTLLAIQEEGRLQVQEIAVRLRAETDPARRRELEAQAVAVKKQTQLRFLETLTGFARQRGDRVAEQQALDQIEILTHPRRAPGTPIRQTPDKSELKGGEK